jgi:hypothetical protein
LFGLSEWRNEPRPRLRKTTLKLKLGGYNRQYNEPDMEADPLNNVSLMSCLTTRLYYNRMDMSAMKDLITKIAEIIKDNFTKRHLKRLQKRENVVRLGISIFILYVLARALLESDLMLGISFIIAGLTAIWFGYVYKGRDVMILVLVGVVIGTFISILAPNAWGALSSGDFISAVIVIGLIIYFYRISSDYKKGKRPKQ